MEEETDSEDESESEEEDEWSSEEEDEDEDGAVVTGSISSSSKNGDALIEYDEVLVQSPFENVGTTIAVMFLAKRVDLSNPKVVRVAR